jgi:hypothetical protein
MTGWPKRDYPKGTKLSRPLDGQVVSRKGAKPQGKGKRAGELASAFRIIVYLIALSRPFRTWPSLPRLPRAGLSRAFGPWLQCLLKRVKMNADGDWEGEASSPLRLCGFAALRLCVRSVHPEVRNLTPFSARSTLRHSGRMSRLIRSPRALLGCLPSKSIAYT